MKGDVKMSEKGKCILAYLFGWIGGLIVLFAMLNSLIPHYLLIFAFII